MVALLSDFKILTYLWRHMVIAVNTRFLLDELEGYGYFIHELFKILVRKHPEHQFYFLFDRAYSEKYFFSVQCLSHCGFSAGKTSRFMEVLV